MQIYHLNKYGDKLPSLPSSAAIIGNFDGVHLGHKQLIEKLCSSPLSHLVITFNNLNKDDLVLSSEEDKIELFKQYDIDYLIFIDFNNFKNVFYNEFIKLLRKLNVSDIICGKDFRFGFKKEGDYIDLENNFQVFILDDCQYHDNKISSSYIKSLVDIDLISKYLGHNYFIRGKVIEGSHIGSKIGIPTANLDYGNYKLPKKGVYACKVYFKEEVYVGVLSIGNNPTLNYQEKTRLEVNILDFNQNIYGEMFKIEFISYIDDIYIFSSREELIENIQKYQQIAKKLVALKQD